MKIHFCTQCGSNHIRFITPQDDSRHRYVCDECGFIHYQNPNIIAGCLVTHHDKVLLCKRAIAPRKDYWTLPAGFMENHETIAEAARRETWEEAQAKVDLKRLYTIFNLPHINQVYIIYYAELIGNDFAPGRESLEVALFPFEKIPWDELAFATIRETLKLFGKDRARGKLGLHSGDIIRPWVLVDAINATLNNLVSA